MRYIFDHDYHIHTELSSCSKDPLQNTAAILEYAKMNNLKSICLADHFWDEKIPGASPWYQKQGYAHIKESLPLPESGDIRYLFGCETELDLNFRVAVSEETMAELDFIVIPTTHLQMNGLTLRGDETPAERAQLWIDRFDAILDNDTLPFGKVGIAHLTCHLMYPKMPKIEVLSRISDSEMHRLFKKAERRNLAIELNFSALGLAEEDYGMELRPFRIAKEEGCRFYFGSDAHHPKELAIQKANAEMIIDLLELEESDKFILK